MEPTLRSALRSCVARGVDAGLHARGDVAGARAEAVDLGVAREVPQRVHVRVARVAVVEQDLGLGEQAGDQEVPHHPAGGGEPEEAVARLQVAVQVHLLQVLEQDAALALHDRLGQPRGAGGVEDPERVVEGHALERELAVEGQQLVPEHESRSPRARRAPRSGRGRGRAAPRLLERGHLRLAAPATISSGRSPCRRSGSRRPPAAPWARSARSGRSRCGRRTPARRSTRWRRGSPWPGRRPPSRGCWACRPPRGRPAPPPARPGPARARATCRASSPQSSVSSPRVSERARMAVARRVEVAEHVLRVVELGPREPLGARHARARPAPRRRSRRLRRSPRPRPRSPRGPRPTSARATRSPSWPCGSREAGQRRARDRLLARGPEQLAAAGRGHRAAGYRPPVREARAAPRPRRAGRARGRAARRAHREPGREIRAGSRIRRAAGADVAAE